MVPLITLDARLQADDLLQSVISWAHWLLSGVRQSVINGNVPAQWVNVLQADKAEIFDEQSGFWNMMIVDLVAPGLLLQLEKRRGVGSETADES